MALRGVISFCLLCLLGVSVYAQPSPEARRNLIRELEAKNRAEKVKAASTEASLTPDQTGGLEDLKKEMAAARLALSSVKTAPSRARAAQATINYVDPLVRLEQYEEAESALKTSLDVGATPQALVQKLAEIRVILSNQSYESGDWNKTQFLLDDTWRTARACEVAPVEQEFAQRLRDLQVAWAETLRRTGQTTDARAKAIEALTWKINTEEIEELLARICYQLDDYKTALDHLRLAMRGPQRDSKALMAFRDLIEKDMGIERSYRRKEVKGVKIAYPGGLAINEAQLASALEEASKTAQAMFRLTTALPIRVTLFQRNDYSSFLLSPSWNKAVSIQGKLRVQMDAIKAATLPTASRYAYGLWIIDVLSEGRAPAWFQEGIAHQLAYPDGPPNGGINELKSRIARKTLIPFRELSAPFMGIPDELAAAVVMAQSQSGIQLIINKSGLEAIPRLVVAYASGLPPEEALQQVTGFGYDAFQETWVKEAKKGFRTDPKPDLSTLRALGVISPLGSYWEQ